MQGVSNLGNTCFLGAVLQCLGHTALLRKYLRRCRFEYHSSVLMLELGALVARMWNSELTDRIDAFNLLQEIRKVNRSFEGNRQHDAHEVLFLLLNVLVDTSPHLLREAFCGRVRSTVRCGNCSKESVMVEDVMDLSLAIPAESTSWFGSVSLEQCIEAHFKPETFSKGNEWACDHCKKADTKSTKQLSIEAAPQILIVHLKRFRAYETKVSTRVTFPLTGLRVGGKLFDLYALIAHDGGSADSGHYIAYCKSGETWIEYDDTTCQTVTAEYLASVEAYVLFFVQRRRPQRPLHRDPDGQYVIPLLHWCKIKTFAEPGRVNNWAVGPVVRVSESIAAEYGGMRIEAHNALMAELAARKRKELALVVEFQKCKVDPGWSKAWMSFINGRSGPPGPIPQQEDKNELWLRFRDIYGAVGDSKL